MAISLAGFSDGFVTDSFAAAHDLVTREGIIASFGADAWRNIPDSDKRQRDDGREYATREAVIDRVWERAPPKSPETPAFKPGDVVMLKSGGPAMTVDSDPDSPELVPVLWFDCAHLRSESFPCACLKRSGPSA